MLLHTRAGITVRVGFRGAARGLARDVRIKKDRLHSEVSASVGASKLRERR